MGEKYRWYPVEEKPHPDKAGIYTCTLNDGKIYEISGCFWGNGWAWNFNRNLINQFDIRGHGEPKVVAWFPIPEPYIPQ